MRRSRRLEVALAAFLFFGFLNGARGAPILVAEDLATTPSSHMSPAPEVFVTTDVGGGILGGSRDVTLTVNAASGVANAVAYAIAGGQLFFAAGPTAQGTLEFAYDAGGAGLGLDLTGLSKLNITFVDFDHANSVDLPVTVTLSDGLLTDSEMLSVTQNIEAGIDPPVTLSFSLALFGVDLTNIQSLKIFFGASEDHDFIVQGEDGITFTNGDVPEPSSLLLWASMALVAGWFTRRKLMKSAA